MLECPVNIHKIKEFQEWLEKEDEELHAILHDLNEEAISNMDPLEYEKIQIRHMKFINLWNYNNIVYEHDNFYLCPLEEGPIYPMKCMLCPYGHMAFECHWPYTCDSPYCSRNNIEGDLED